MRVENGWVNTDEYFEGTPVPKGTRINVSRCERLNQLTIYNCPSFLKLPLLVVVTILGVFSVIYFGVPIDNDYLLGIIPNEYLRWFILVTASGQIVYLTYKFSLKDPPIGLDIKKNREIIVRYAFGNRPTMTFSVNNIISLNIVKDATTKYYVALLVVKLNDIGIRTVSFPALNEKEAEFMKAVFEKELGLIAH